MGKGSGGGEKKVMLDLHWDGQEKTKVQVYRESSKRFKERHEHGNWLS
jgi:hypothetical protein